MDANIDLAKFDGADYKRSRIGYISFCASEYLIQLLVADAFLAKLLTSLGVSDAVAGIVASFITIAFTVQLLTLPLMQTNLSKKTLVAVFETLSALCFLLAFATPFVPISGEARKVLVVLAVLAAFVFKYLVSPMVWAWCNSYVSPYKRGSYSATKEMVSLVLGMIFSAAIGYVIDHYEGLDNLNGAFLFISVSILILTVLNLAFIITIKKDEPTQTTEKKESLFQVLKVLAKNKSYRNFLLLDSLWSASRYFSLGFIGVFKNDLIGSLLLIQIINIVANLVRLAVSVPFGKYADKHGYAKCFRIALIIAAVSYFANMFATSSTVIFLIIHTVLYNCCMAGWVQNANNMLYNYVEIEHFSQALAIKNFLGGVVGFLASLVGGVILSAVQGSGIQIFGEPLYGQQVLSALSFVGTLVAILFVMKVVEKQKTIVQ